MTKNIGNTERVIRIVIGVAVISSAFFGSSDKGPWYLLGLVPLLTGLMGWCPPYALFGVNTCPKNEKN